MRTVSTGSTDASITDAPPSGRLTTHVLDTMHGCPAAGMTVQLWHRHGANNWQSVCMVTLNEDGRAPSPLLAGPTMQAGIYRLTFEVGAYFKARAVALPSPAFLDQVPVEFGIADAQAHYHVPLLTSPWSYATYRGS